MSNVTINSDNHVVDHENDLFREYVGGNGFEKFSGKSGNTPIVVKEVRAGKTLSFPFATKIVGKGKKGSEALRGNGVNIGNYADTLTPTYERQAAEFDKEEMEKPEFDIHAESKPMLMEWGRELVKEQMIDAFCAVANKGGVSGVYNNFGDASEAEKDAWSVNNVDRILYGANTSNHSGDVSVDLAKIDSTNDKLSKGMIGTAKRMAQTTSPRIKPWKTKDVVYNQFIMFVGSRAYRDLYNSSEVQGDYQNARERAKSNPLYMPGDLMFDNVLVREIPEITSQLTESEAFKTVGNGGISVEPCFLCGASAVGYGISRRPKLIEDNTYDYGFQPGVAVEMKHHIKKLFLNEKQHGMVTVFVSGVADS